MKNGQMLKHLSWIGKIVKIHEMLLKKITFLVGLAKIFGRSVKNFGRPGQFLKVWKKIRNVREKISEKMYGKNSRGSKILATMGRGDLLKFYLPPQKMRVAPQMPPPQSLRPSAATESRPLKVKSGTTYSINFSRSDCFELMIRKNTRSCIHMG